jgi:hypothetical protein
MRGVATKTLVATIDRNEDATAFGALPDLIEAAEPILEELREDELAYIDDDDELRDYHSVSIPVAKLRTLRSALAKAKGENQ